jgi:outer membrane receptor protein involved in Fe transport
LLPLLLGWLAAAPPAAGEVEGVVRDAAGAAVAGARVTFHAGGTDSATLTGPDGRFSIPGRAAAGWVAVEAAGFAPFRRSVDPLRPDASTLTIVLRRAFAEEVTVAAARVPEPLAETPASVVVLGSRALELTPALAVDDVLRQVPGFTLFRRSGSRTANPTTQGASLRGLGGSGASRALVLDDGVPLNDPFGGWIYWSRVPRASLERVEVLRGGASDLYGSGALSGVIHIVRKRPERTRVDLDASYGSQSTPDASMAAALRRGSWGLKLDATAFATDGYVLVAPGERGAVDTAASSRHGGFELAVERAPDASSRQFAALSAFHESRDNGTPLQTNDTRLRQVVVGADRTGSGTLNLRAYAGDELYHQTFSTIATDRSSERLNRQQRVPAEVAGAWGQWTRPIGRRHVIVAGADARRVEATSEEVVFNPGAGPLVGNHGRQLDVGLYAEDMVALGRLSATAALRLDRWGQSGERRSPGTPTATLPDHDESALSPRLSIRYRASSWLSLNSSAYRSFRAPTLNELYRPFRLGNVLTLANEGLRAERMRGIEAGVLGRRPDGRLSVRANFFWNEVHDAVANVTLSATPALITRQRQNVALLRARGLETDAEARLGDAFTATASWLFVASTVVASDPPALVGLRVPQVPRHQGSLSLRYAHPALRAALQVRFAGRQFDDDLNLFPLGDATMVDLLAARPLGRDAEVYVAAENLLDTSYDVGRTPVRTLGPPRSVRAGIRLHISARP